MAESDNAAEEVRRQLKTMNDDYTEGLAEIAAASGTETDPLAELEEVFDRVDADPFDLYLEIKREQDIVEGSFRHYERTFRQWDEYMLGIGRHPACPSETHVQGFANFYLDKGNNPSTVRKKLERLQAAYNWFQNKEHFPHPVDFNPFGVVLSERNLKGEKAKNYPDLDVDDLRNTLGDIKNIRERAIKVTELKTGARSSELGNLQLAEINISHPDVRKHYDEIGTHDYVCDRPNSVYFPPDREHNKRERHTVLPLDEETRQCIVDWLLIRPDNGEKEVFLTDKGNPMGRTDVGHLWRKHWWPEYEFGEEAEYRSISPHFARHFFSNWWMVEKGMNEELVKYMRGDMTGRVGDSQAAIYRYLNAQYENIEDIYRDQIFQLYLEPV